ncbi:UDP-glucose dehydrogenase family protein [Chloroflexota bacterium]
MIIKDNQKVCVIGIWHLGSVYSVCLAELGYVVNGVDTNPGRVDNLNKGIPPIFEPELEDFLKKNIEAGRLKYTSDIHDAVKDCKYVLITFDTPVDENDDVDLSPIFTTCRELAGCLENGVIIIVSSQVPVGTCNELKNLIQKRNPSLKFGIACNPENLRLGQAINYFKNQDRIVIGADDDVTLASVEKLLSVIRSPILRMNLRTAEMTKHALNAYLAATISFGNEIANLCDEVGADAIRIVEALRSDARLSPRLPLLPGLAFGGGTLARDLKILKRLGENTGTEMSIINSVLRVNQRQNGLVLRKLRKIFGSVDKLNIAILGLAYKSGTSTLRRSPALEIIKDLVSNGAVVKAYDPKVTFEEVNPYDEFEFVSDPYITASEADALVIATDWPEFKDLDFALLHSVMKSPVIIDAKNMLDREKLLEKGFTYSGVGRG